MAIVNGGYAKITKRIYEVGFRTDTGSARCDFVIAASAGDARRIAPRHHTEHVTSVISEDDMSPNRRWQAHEEIRTFVPRKSYMPSRSEPLLDRG